MTLQACVNGRPGRYGGPAACSALGCGVHRIGRIEEVTKVSRLIKRVPYAGVACASAPPKTDSQALADKAMAERVEAALSADKSLFAKHITAHADNGVVHLTGYVWEAGDFEEATFIASNVPGVTKVVNDLELNRNGNEASPATR
jgi:osmotically-inducible protein OsmY